MKILFVMLSLADGGAEKSLVNLLNELPEDRYQVDLMLYRGEGLFLSQVPSWVNMVDPPEAVRKLYAPVSQAGKYAVLKTAGTLISRAKERDRSRSEGYRWQHFYKDHIPCVTEEYDTAIAYASEELLAFVGDKVSARRKLVWVHNDYLAAGFSRDYDFPYMQRFDGIVSISDQCVRILQQVFPEFQDKIYNIANITSSAVIRYRAEEFTPSEMNPDDFNILSIGRLEYQKGFDMAVEAASILKKRGISFKWYVIGGGRLRADLERQISHTDTEDRVILLGTRDNPYPYIRRCRCMVQPSRYEGKSVVLDEAKILARPIIATNYPTVHDQVAEGLEGLIVDQTPEAIANGIERMLTDDALRTSITEYLRSHEYGNQSEVIKYMALIEGKPMPMG